MFSSSSNHARGLLSRTLVFAALAALATTLFGCSIETVIHDINEKEANEIIVLLANHDIPSGKGIRDTGRQVFYSINVPTTKRDAALAILNDNDHPRRQIEGYGEVFADSGLIPTQAEEKAKEVRAIEGEIEKQLTLITGILDSQVNLVLPEESMLRTGQEARVPTTASVAVKYLPGKGGIKPLSEQSIRAIVAAGVEKLTQDHVVVVMTEARAMLPLGSCAEVSGSGGRGIFGKLSEKAQKLMLAAIVVLILILSLLLVFGQMRLRNIRGRLIRLQNEIAKARRKAPELAATE